ncbi:uncharacterized protein LOC123505254 [Portunus trituberculatus]|uniref:Uncharacterized protein n=1 Tax=Portunus trituberculatus TaxID=210409 RepID=A0A5B7DAU2_PORTR|nr:uncharacterized protein LOC123505254 [Portunus trituberculatus]MPC18377.1 hypothetical protein [Portunus trituberculatus]
MKRFWLEDAWHWSSTARMTLRTVPGGLCLYYLFIIICVHFVPSSSTVGETCDIHTLSSCPANELCEQVNKTSAICKCLPTVKCDDPQPPPEPPGNHLGLALGLSITIFLLLVILILIVLHRKFGLFSGMCDRFPSLRHLTIRSGDIIMVDNDDEPDINPIA